MGLIIRLAVLLGSLIAAGGFFAWALAEMFATAREILLPFMILSTAILAAALGYLVSALRQR
jgi:hypothetical protein